MWSLVKGGVDEIDMGGDEGMAGAGSGLKPAETEGLAVVGSCET